MEEESCQQSAFSNQGESCPILQMMSLLQRPLYLTGGRHETVMRNG